MQLRPAHKRCGTRFRPSSLFDLVRTLARPEQPSHSGIENQLSLADSTFLEQRVRTERASSQHRHLSGAAGETKVFPKPVPVPDPVSSSFGQTVAELVSQCDHLTTVMRFVGEHVREHGRTSRPHGCPTAAREFCHSPIRVFRQRFPKHLKVTHGALSVGGGCLLYGAANGIKWRRASEMRCRTLQRNQAVCCAYGQRWRQWYGPLGGSGRAGNEGLSVAPSRPAEVLPGATIRVALRMQDL